MKQIAFDDPNLSAYGTMYLDIEGTSPLVQNRWSKKAIEEMEAKQRGKALKKKAPKDPEQNFLDSLHCIGQRPESVDDLPNTRFGVPATSFKAAMVRMAKLNGLPMSDARVMFFVEHDAYEDGAHLVEIEAEEPSMYRAPVRIPGSADIRYRGMFEPGWKTTLRVKFNARQISAEQIVSLANSAGIGCGVGEGRPGGKNSSGNFGTFVVTKATGEIPDLDGKEAKKSGKKS